MERLKIGFLVNNPNYIDQSSFEIIDNINKNDNFFCKPIIIYGYTRNRYYSKSLFEKIKTINSYSKLKYLMSKFFYINLIRFVQFIEFFIVKKIYKDFNKTHNLSDISYKKIEVDGIWSKSKLVLSFSQNDIKKLQEENFDVLIRTGSGILKGDILKVPKFGILSFHHGDNRVNRGGPSGFWEALNKEISIGFIIQKINQELDGGNVIYRGNLTAHKLWHMNMATLSKKSSIFMIKTLEEIYKYKKIPNYLPPSIYDREYYSLHNKPNIVLKYIIKILLPYLLNNLNGRLFGFPLSRWSIAYSKNADEFKALKKFKEIKNPKGRFFADPFIFSSNKRDIIFVEDYSFKNEKGCISAIEIKNNKDKFLGVVLEEDFHLSFPFVFKNENKIYMVPESAGSDQIRLYECIQFPMKWKFKCTLMDNISAVDTIIIKKEDIWFMLTNICSAKIDNHSSELHIFYSYNLFSNEWSPIKQTNPVIFDSRKARNGGIFFNKGNIYRVNQVQTPETYGYSLKINLIKKIDKFIYEEQTIDEIKPFFKKDICGTHHFHSYEGISVIDFHRKKFFRDIFKNN